MSVRNILRAALVGCAALAGVAVHAASQSSASYAIPADALNAGADFMSSATRQMRSSIGGAASGAGSTSASYALKSGFLGQAIPLTSLPPVNPPSTPDMTDATDTGASNTDNITRNLRPTFTGTCATGNTVQLLVDGASIPPSVTCAAGAYSIVPDTQIANGNHAIAAIASNGGSPSAPSPALAVTMDNVPPTTSIVSGPSGTVASASASFTFESSEPGSTFRCRLDAAAFADCTNPQAFTGLAAGSHTVTVRAVDVAGNTDTGNAARTWTVAAPRPSAFDFNGDTHPDLLWSNTANGATYVWYMNGPVLISDAFITQVDPSWKVQGVADFNGDGDPDLVWRNTATGATYVWYMDGTNLVSDALLFALPPEWVIQGVADFNADGKPDFLLRNTVSGVAFAWFFDGATPIGDQYLFAIDPAWKVEAVADLDGDNQPDLLFRSMTSGLAFAWSTQYAGGVLSLAGSSAPIFGIDPVWEIVQMEDWNADGSPDLLFRNRDTGLVFVWYMNGTTLAGSDFVTQIDPSWEIVPRR